MGFIRDVLKSWRQLRAKPLLFVVLTALIGIVAVKLIKPAMVPHALAGGKSRPQAPELTGGTDWLNTTKPISLAGLKGHVVVLDFWTLCCINCIHTLPDLAKLEAKYAGILVVLGIHTPKFENEKETESIRKAILRYEVKHPVLNDANQAVWRRFNVDSWPTLILIDPDGNIVGRISGEGAYDVLDENIDKLVKEFRAKKTLNEQPIDFELAKEKVSSPLFFPGKVVADAAGNRLFIADSTHHRIVVTDLAGKKIAIAGTGVSGLKDGSFAEAQFSDPQGMALLGNVLYVADRKNHSIRALDLDKQIVTRVAGTGQQDRENRTTGGQGIRTGLNSPWDLLQRNGIIYVAMAGAHQIWMYNPATERIDPFAGAGNENIRDGAFAEAAFAQPSGLATDGTTLYVADSEVSAIRALPFDSKGSVRTIVGQGLFTFGDVDGVGSKVRLQHALGVAYYKGLLYVADTYNSKIKQIDPKTNTCVTFSPQTEAGSKERPFEEPAGLSFAGDKLYVADTNNHRIRVIDMNTRAISTLALEGVEPPARR